MQNRGIVFALLVSCLLTTASSFAEATCAKVSNKDIAALFDRWNDSLKTDDAAKVDANYTDKAILLPTFSNTPKVTRSQRIEYFKNFLAKHPTATIDSRNIKIGCNSAIDTGLYTFTLEDGKKLHARYTFTYRWDGRQWLISSHHSSSLPEK
jgi:uncharacterized protein (TIGR02246 family)